MKLQEIFDQLSAGEFSMLNIGGQEMGVINEANYKQVVSHVNLGLAALYRRFPLKEKSLTLSLKPNTLIYTLKSDYAVANRRSSQPIRYILDTADAPFKDDIFKIEQVLTEFGQHMGLNDLANPLACMTPNMITLTVPEIVVNPTSDTPYWLRTEHLTVKYRANHPAIVIGLGLFDPSKVDIELPYSHLEALLWYVASRVHNPVGMNNEFHAGNMYAQKYELACQELERVNMRIDQGQTNMKLDKRGFV